MGCTTSAVLLERLRSILERSCTVKGVSEQGVLEEEMEEERLSLRDQLLISDTAVVR